MSIDFLSHLGKADMGFGGTKKAMQPSVLYASKDRTTEVYESSLENGTHPAGRENRRKSM